MAILSRIQDTTDPNRNFNIARTNARTGVEPTAAETNNSTENGLLTAVIGDLRFSAVNEAVIQSDGQFRGSHLTASAYEQGNLALKDGNLYRANSAIDAADSETVTIISQTATEFVAEVNNDQGNSQAADFHWIVQGERA